MALEKRIFIAAFLITLFLLMSVLLIGSLLDNRRYAAIDEQFQSVYVNINEMQTFSLMADVYGDEMACIAYEKKLQEMDRSLWNLGQKIDAYRQASEEFLKDPYYRQQKKLFNENEVTYLLLLKVIKKRCSYNQSIILFFYKNSKDCNKCDDQSFVLNDINRKIDKDVAIFSFDTELGITSIELLSKYYRIDTYPCTIVEDEKLCGIQDYALLIDRICTYQPGLTVCPE